MPSGDPAKIAAAENMLTQSLKSLFAVSEAYPDLKAIQAFTDLQEQLTATEDKIEFARRYYNGSVRDFNNATQQVPSSIIAGMFGFHPMEFFEAAPEDREVPKVSFDQQPPAQPPPAQPPAVSDPAPADAPASVQTSGPDQPADTAQPADIAPMVAIADPTGPVTNVTG